MRVEEAAYQVVPGSTSSETQAKRLNLLKTCEPEGLRTLGENDWETIEWGVDSGATETVIGRHDLSHVETKEGVAKRRGVEYEVANGEKIPNEGETRFIGYCSDGQSGWPTSGIAGV